MYPLRTYDAITGALAAADRRFSRWRGRRRRLILSSTTQAIRVGDHTWIAAHTDPDGPSPYWFTYQQVTEMEAALRAILPDVVEHDLAAILGLNR